jgi:hypothetical protein
MYRLKDENFEYFWCFALLNIELLAIFLDGLLEHEFTRGVIGRAGFDVSLARRRGSV